jgi:AhpD family alkylhydroperoxidase
MKHLQGGVPIPMSEANRTRWGGGIHTYGLSSPSLVWEVCKQITNDDNLFCSSIKFYSNFVIETNNMGIVQEFNDYREKMNDVILKNNNLVMKRLWNLDTNTYDEGVLDKKTKEMLGLVSSMVLRCDDCIKYHLGKCFELGLTTPEIYEIFSVANVVGGTIVVPHTRRAAEYWEALLSETNTEQ